MSKNSKPPRQYTPGPWKTKVCNGIPVVMTADIGGTFIAEISNEMHDSAMGNANLISAAPDLLEALELAAAVLSGEEMSKSTLITAMEKSRGALRKAKGEEA